MQTVDFMDWWARLNLALDDVGLPERGFQQALVIYRVTECTHEDFDRAIADEVAASKEAAQAAVALVVAGGCRS